MVMFINLLQPKRYRGKLRRGPSLEYREVVDDFSMKSEQLTLTKNFTKLTEN